MNEEEKKAIELLEELDWLYLDFPETECSKYEDAANRIISDYKRVLKENEQLRTEVNSLKEDNERYQELELQINFFSLYNNAIEENKKLKNKLLDTLEGQKVIKEETPQYIKENYILKSKLKDIIDRIDYDIKKTKEIISKNTNIYASYRKNDYQIVRLRAMNTKSLDIKNRLQELLELSELNSEFNSEGKSEV